MDKKNVNEECCMWKFILMDEYKKGVKKYLEFKLKTEWYDGDDPWINKWDDVIKGKLKLTRDNETSVRFKYIYQIASRKED